MVVKSRGAPVSVALFKRKHRQHQPFPHIVCTYADAATDSAPPGIGGYCHDAFWFMELTAEHVRWIYITALELLATGFNAITFAPL
eukprot:5379667-Pleurochrysis_carterae.AAC.1